MTMSVENFGVWAYAIMHADRAGERVGGLRGVADEPVRAVFAGGLAAAVGTVGMGEFGQDALRRNLEDLDWLAAKARAHDAVVSGIARFGPVIPVRLATLYLDDSRVEELLANRHAAFDAALHRVSGREELGVKAYADPEGLLPAEEKPQPGGGRGSGTAYLLRRRRQLVSQEEARRLAAVEAEYIHATLMKCAVDGKRKPAVDQSLSGSAAWTVLNGTYLVDQASEELFRETVAALDRTAAHIRLEVTGPWPPYSFAGELEAS
jgi:hypothetical protein